jgi:hypothetical protein
METANIQVSTSTEKTTEVNKNTFYFSGADYGLALAVAMKNQNNEENKFQPTLYQQNLIIAEAAFIRTKNRNKKLFW